MSDVTQLADLISRLETASKGSRELDRAIHLVVFADFIKEYGAVVPPQDYTTSVDAAITLLPEKWSWKLVYEPTYTAAGPRYCVVLRQAEKLEFVGLAFVCSKETPALALCTVALKARMTA